MINKNILILEGGFNEEHEVSLKSSLEIQKVLNNIGIRYKTLRVNPKNFKKKILKYSNYLCFNALHGPFGEDGQIQKILKENNIEFTHSGITSSKRCFNKLHTKKLILKNNILTPKYTVLKKSDLNEKNLLNFKILYKKFIIKPTNSGSSYGIKIIKSNKDLKKFINNLEKFKQNITFHNYLLIEEFITGKELTVSTINFSKKIEPLAVTEIKSKNTFFDYEAKYTKGYARHILPANIDKKNYNKCLKQASKIHKLLGCNSIARSDFILNTYKNKLYFLETNTQPGLTSVSLVPEQAKFRNISFENIILGVLKNIN